MGKSLLAGIAANFKALRINVGLNQDLVAKALDIPRTAVVGIESGDREISLKEFDALCRIYRISPNEILGWNRTKAKGDDERAN